MLNDSVNEIIREVTAYNVEDPKQNQGDPCISANGENICVALDLGFKRCAANFVPFGTKITLKSILQLVLYNILRYSKPDLVQVANGNDSARYGSPDLIEITRQCRGSVVQNRGR